MSWAKPTSQPMRAHRLAERAEILGQRLGGAREQAVGRDVDRHHVDAERLEQLRRDERAGAVARVERDAQAAAAGGQRAHGVENRLQVEIDAVGHPLDRPHLGAADLHVLALVIDVEQLARGAGAEEQAVRAR